MKSRCQMNASSLVVIAIGLLIGGWAYSQNLETALEEAGPALPVEYAQARLDLAKVDLEKAELLIGRIPTAGPDTKAPSHRPAVRTSKKCS